MRWTALGWALAVALGGGCDDGGEAAPAPDARPADAAQRADATPPDPAPGDATPLDAQSLDAGPLDAGPLDSAPPDATPVDAAPADGRPADAAPDPILDARSPVDRGPEPDAAPPRDAEIDAAPLDLPDAAPPCPDGTWAAGTACIEPWPCPEGWQRDADDGACLPPPALLCTSGLMAPAAGDCAAAWPCPDHWIRGDDGGCVPLAEDCGDASLLPDGTCLDLPACPDATFADGDWPADAVFVDPRAPVEGADGTLDHPYPDLVLALQAEARTIALAPGDYGLGVGQVDDADFALLGVCAGSVRVEASIVAGLNGTVTVRGVSLFALGPFALAAQGGRVEVTDSVLFGGTDAVALATGGGHLQLERAVVVGPDARYGLGVTGEATLVARRVVIDRARETAIGGENGATLTLDGVVINGVEARGEGRGVGLRLLGAQATAHDLWVQDVDRAVFVQGAGARASGARWLHLGVRAETRSIEVATGARLEVQDLALGSAAPAAVLVRDPGSVARIRRAVVVESGGPSLNDAAITVLDDGELDAEQLLVLRPRYRGVAVLGGRAQLRDLVVRSATPDARLGLGRAVEVGYGAEVILQRALLVATAERALVITAATVEADRLLIVGAGRSGIESTDSDLTLVDSLVDRAGRFGVLGQGDGTLRAIRLRVTGTRPPGALDEGGYGLALSDQDAVLTDVAITENVEGGLVVAGDAVVRADRLLVRATRGVLLPAGVGVHVADGAEVELNAARVLASEQSGASVFAATLRARDLVIEDTRGRSRVGDLGRGLNAEEGATVVLDRAHLARNRDVGLRVSDPGSRLEATQVTVADTRGRLIDDASGIGVTVGTGATLVAADLHVLGNQTTGVSVQGGDLVADRLIVRDTAPGPDGLADGLFAGDGAQIDLRDLVSEGNTRHGVVLSGTRGRVAGGRVRFNQIGVVDQLTNGVTRTDLIVRDNAEADTTCLNVCVEVPPPPRAAGGLPPP